MTTPGLLISIDGPAGAGKTTLTALTATLLTNLGHRVHTTTEPSPGPIGALARTHADTLHGLTLACLVAADRYHHLDTELRPHRDAGHLVLCDRYLPSTFVLQTRDGVSTDFLHTLNAHADLPDLAILLTIDPTAAAARVHTRGAHDRFHQGADSTHHELTLYRDVAAWLTEREVPVLTLDTTHSTPEDLATHIAHHIHRMTSPDRAPSTPG